MSLSPTPDVSSRYGAPMGRMDTGLVDFGARLYLRRVPLNPGGYDAGGAYWGVPSNLWAWGDGEDWRFLRARSRDAAKQMIRDMADIDPATVRFFR